MPKDADHAPVLDPAPEPAPALWLVEQAEARGTLLHIARGEGRLDRLAEAAQVFADGRVEVLVLPPWDVLPLSLYRRLARMAEVAEFEDELADRFGPLPPAVAPLLALIRLRLLCARAGVARLDSGPQAAALTPRDPAQARRLAGALKGRVREGRVILDVSGPRAQARVERLAALLGG